MRLLVWLAQFFSQFHAESALFSWLNSCDAPERRLPLLLCGERTIPVRQCRVAIFVFLVGVLTSAPGFADTITFSLEKEYTGATPPAATPPWLVAVFEDIGASIVRLTMSAPSLTGFEFVKEWLFNVDPAVNPADLAFSLVSGSTAEAATIDHQSNSFSAGGGARFDVRFGFQTNQGAGRLTDGEVAIYDITAPSLTASSFNVLSTGGGKGGLLTSAKIQGIGSNGQQSGWGTATEADITTVPEPGTLLLLGGGLAFAVRRARRRS